MIEPEEFTSEEAIAMGAFHEDALSLEDILGDQEIIERIERGENIAGADE